MKSIICPNNLLNDEIVNEKKKKNVNSVMNYYYYYILFRIRMDLTLPINVEEPWINSRHVFYSIKKLTDKAFIKQIFSYQNMFT